MRRLAHSRNGRAPSTGPAKARSSRVSRTNEIAVDAGARLDAAGIPTYLESSNPANDHRYERQGYRKVGEFATVLGHAVVSTMWRPARG
jgi:hypothetical protein